MGQLPYVKANSITSFPNLLWMWEEQTLFTDANHFAYSGVLTQAVQSPEELRPVVFTLDSFSEMQQRWSATRKEAYAVYQSMLRFDLYLRGAKCVLHYKHILLESFLSKLLSSTSGQ